MDTQEADFHREIKVEIFEDLFLNHENEEKGPAFLSTDKSARESQNEDKFSLWTYVKTEPTSETEVATPSGQVQSSQFSRDTIKEESLTETKFLIQEEISIKSEEEENGQSNTKPARVEIEKGYSPSFLDGPNKTDTNRDHSHFIEPSVFKCLDCSYQTHRKRYLSHHMQKHTGITFKCVHCPYETWDNWYLKTHQLVHASEEDVDLHKCPECPYTSKRKGNVTKHLAVHKTLDKLIWFHRDMPMYKCTLCSYESPRNDSLKRHVQRRHQEKDVEPMGCPEEGCLFITRKKLYLTSHIRRMHKRNEVFKCSKRNEVFKCSNCVFQTKQENQFKAHTCGHENPDKWHSCTLCPYKTTRRYDLNSHSVVHKNESEVKWFQCLECSFKTRHKRNLCQHKLSHNQLFEKLLECSECQYKTPYALYLRRHLLKHKDPASKTWFQCSQCPYRTTYKSNLKTHNYAHKSADEIQWLRCPTCPYKTHRKDMLKSHQLVHRRPEEISDWYYCYICMWKTYTKACLAKHINTLHRDAEGKIYSGL